VLVAVTHDLVGNPALSPIPVVVLKATIYQRGQKNQRADEIDDFHGVLLSSVMPDWDTGAAFPRGAIADDRHICQKHPVSLPPSDHCVDPLGQETRCDVSVTQFAGPLQVDPRDINGLFQQL
jgi:hypothetical protein